jgi:obg-like ATPase 1
MPPKKAEEAPKKVLLGRPKNNVAIGIVGLPNVGKSTFFNILCKMNVAAENFPFCTIDPNVSRVPVPDERFDHLVEKYKPKSVVPAVLTVTDIAGLVKGAAEGQGLGNAFLSHIQAVDAIYHVTRAFDSDEVIHVEGSVDPCRDLDIIHNELLKKDVATIQGKIEALKRPIELKRASKDQEAEYKLLLTLQNWCEVEKKEVRHGDWKPEDIETLNKYQLLTAKPVIYLVNMSEKGYIAKKSKHLPLLAEWLKKRESDDKMIPFSCEFEGKLASMTPEEAAKYCETVGAKSALPRIIKTGYHALQLVHFFTAGEDEVRAWSVKRDTPAPAAAGVIHTGEFRFA